jgi:hypothetical protein
MALTINTANASGANSSSFASVSASWSHTISGNANRVLYVIAGMDDAASHSATMTYNGSGTGVVKKFDLGTGGGSDKNLICFQLKQADLPAAGTYTVALSWTTGVAYAAVAFEAYDVDQTTPSDTEVSNESAATSQTATVTSATGDIVIGAVVINAPQGSDPTPSVGTSINLQTNAQVALRVAYWSGAASVNTDFTSTAFEQYRIASFNLNAGAGGGGGIPRAAMYYNRRE